MEGVKEGSGRFLREEGSRWRTNKLLGRDTLDLLEHQHGGLGREDKEENSAGGGMEVVATDHKGVSTGVRTLAKNSNSLYIRLG